VRRQSLRPPLPHRKHAAPVTEGGSRKVNLCEARFDTKARGVGPTLTLWPALAYVAAMWASMTALASGWHWCKHRQPGIAQWVRVGVDGLLLGRLL